MTEQTEETTDETTSADQIFDNNFVSETVETTTTTTEEEPETFPREYVAKLRDESAKHRTRAQRADDLAARLHTALVTATGRLADPSDLPFDESHVDDAEALTAAIDALLTRKPHLASGESSETWGKVSPGEPIPSTSPGCSGATPVREGGRERSAERSADRRKGGCVAMAEVVVKWVMCGQAQCLACREVNDCRPGVGEDRPSAWEPDSRAEATDVLGARLDVSGDGEVVNHRVVLGPHGDQAGVRVGKCAVKGLPEVPLQQVAFGVIEPRPDDRAVLGEEQFGACAHDAGRLVDDVRVAERKVASDVAPSTEAGGIEKLRRRGIEGARVDGLSGRSGRGERQRDKKGANHGRDQPPEPSAGAG